MEFDFIKECQSCGSFVTRVIRLIDGLKQDVTKFADCPSCNAHMPGWVSFDLTGLQQEQEQLKETAEPVQKAVKKASAKSNR